tara:strand:- start:171 stop:449 length:279 start_codon:yes stop_codon:yes gene_type:complete
MVYSLKETIAEFLEKKEIKDKIIDHSIHNNWKKIVGEKIAEATEVNNIRNKVLYIKTKSPAWRTELTFQKKEIITKIKEEIPEIKLREIRFI